MGNTNSTLVVQSSNTNLNGLFASVPGVSGQRFAPAILTNQRSDATLFYFNGQSTQPSLLGASTAGTVLGAIVNILEPQQRLVFSSGTNGNNQKLFDAYGDRSSRRIVPVNNTVAGRPLNLFYSCDTGNNAFLNVGTTVPSGCSQLQLLWTPT